MDIADILCVLGAVRRSEKLEYSEKWWKNIRTLAIGGVDTEENEYFDPPGVFPSCSSRFGLAHCKIETLDVSNNHLDSADAAVPRLAWPRHITLSEARSQLYRRRS